MSYYWVGVKLATIPGGACSRHRRYVCGMIEFLLTTSPYNADLVASILVEFVAARNVERRGRFQVIVERPKATLARQQL